jgi:hypothetical protein
MTHRRHAATAFLMMCSLAAATSCAKPREQQLMPIYRVATPTVNAEQVRTLAESTFGISGQVERRDGWLASHSGDQVAELSQISGAAWVANWGQLWRPEIEPMLPDSGKALAIARAFFDRTRLLPSDTTVQAITVSYAGLGATHAVYFKPDVKERQHRQLDVQIRYQVKVRNLPVVGGGGEFNLTLGDAGAIIGFSGLWRPVVGVETQSPMISQQEADRHFRDLTSGTKIASFNSFLAYYSAPPNEKQEYLYPVYVYSAKAVVDGDTMPMRLVTLPATEFGPKLEMPPTAAPRPEDARPTSSALEAEGREEQRMPADSGFYSRPAEASIAPTAQWPTVRLASLRPTSSGVRNGIGSLLQANWREAGVSYIGTSGGLSGSQANANGFLNELSADGWSTNFNWGNAAAWESDWHRNDDEWVDATDFVFYTGHANMNGWVLRSPDDGFLRFDEVGASPQTPGDMWGTQDLEWLVIAACGPLQDEILSAGGGNVFDRWTGAFDGLHLLLGYGAVTYDNKTEGKTLVKYARRGQTLINAWFRTAREIQPSNNGSSAPNGPTIWVGVIFGYRSGTTTPAKDHLWLHGSVAPDPTNQNVFVAMWTTT